MSEEDDDDLLFNEEDEEEETAAGGDGAWKVMVVDDEPAVHDVTRVAIGNIIHQGKPLHFIDAYSGEEAKRMIHEHPDTALILLDVVMESDDAGLRVVRYIREEAKNHFVRIVLRTGQPGQAPETEIILNYDINDYKEKTELTKQKLFTTVISCLRSYNDMMTIEHSRRRLEENEHILRLAKRSAETANKAKTTFLSKMSHELLTPLNAIIGYSDMLQDEALDAGLDDFIPDIRKIREAGERLGRLYTCILNMSKIEADKLNVSPETFSVRDLVEEVVINLQEQAKQHHNHVTIHCEESSSMHTDRNMLFQVLSCLLNNAEKFTDNGSVEVSVHRLTKNDSQWLAFSVADTGIGISVEQINSIFHPFSQADDTTTRIYDGAGLGLTIAQNYCDVLGGQILVESTLGSGSIFTVQVPANILEVE